jgi:hypothetical protein
MTRSMVTGRFAGDVVLLVVLASVVVLSVPRLRVYYNVTVVDVTVQRIGPDGRREQLNTPEQFAHFERGYTRGDRVPETVERAIDRYMAGLGAEAEAAGTRYEWTVRYSHNSTKLDRQHLVVREVGHAPQ